MALYRAGEQDFFSIKELGVESRGLSHGRVVFDRPGEFSDFEVIISREPLIHSFNNIRG